MPYSETATGRPRSQKGALTACCLQHFRLPTAAPMPTERISSATATALSAQPAAESAFQAALKRNPYF